MSVGEVFDILAVLLQMRTLKFREENLVEQLEFVMQLLGELRLGVQGESATERIGAGHDPDGRGHRDLAGRAA